MFTTRHMFGLAGVKGRFELSSGEIKVAEPLSDSQVEVVIDATSFMTGNSRRDDDVKSDRFLDVTSNPEITFRSTALVQEAGTWVLRGEVTARGNAAPAELTIAESRIDDEGFVARATCKIDRYAHGIVKAKGMAARYLTLEITARALRA